MDWLSLIIGIFVGFGLSRVVNLDFRGFTNRPEDAK